MISRGKFYYHSRHRTTLC